MRQSFIDGALDEKFAVAVLDLIRKGERLFETSYELSGLLCPVCRE
jgi:hypothetical protein